MKNLTTLQYGFKFIYYSRPHDAAEVTWNIHRVHNTNQFLQNFVFFAKTVTNFFHIFIFHKKYPISSRISTSSFDEQDVLWIRLCKWFENNYFPMMLWLGPNGEVNCKLFYSANVMKEGIFSKWRGSELANKYTIF